jgi:hypothetical protein
MWKFQSENADLRGENSILTLENTRLLQEKATLQLQAAKADTEVRQMTKAHHLGEKEHEINQKAIRGLKERVDTAEGELERLKRKRKESVSPDRVVTGILKRPGTSPPSVQKSGKANTPPVSAQPALKKSRTRRNRFEERVTELAHTSFNQVGVKENKEQASQVKRRVFDPVLTNPPSSVRRKNDIINEIEESAKSFSLTGKDTSFVFHRYNVDHQVVVTKKALAYVETLITTTCVHLLKGAKVEGNPVQAYLSTLSLSRIKELQKEVDAALEQCEDSNKHMAVYRGGEDLAQRIRAQSFSRDGKHALKPHKATDSLQRLHERLGCHKQYSIPIGFYYAKWSEKIHFHLSKFRKLGRSPSLGSSGPSRTPSPRTAPTLTRGAREGSPKMTSSPAAGVVTYSIEEGVDALKVLQETRAAIFDDTKDGLLTLSKHHKAIFWYRQTRRLEWQEAEAGTMLNEAEWNARYDQQSLERLKETEEQYETLLEEHLKSIGDGPAGQESN